MGTEECIKIAYLSKDKYYLKQFMSKKIPISKDIDIENIK